VSTAPATQAAPAAGLRTATDRLRAAAASRRPCAPVRTLLPDGDITAAYAVQTALVQSWTAAGARVVGRKVGLTNPAVQEQLGVDQPDFGVLLDDMLCPPGRPVDIGRLMQPKIEAEIGFVLRTGLDDGPLTLQRVRAAIDYAVPALEVVDSRIADWDIGIVDTVADNASAGLFVLGPTRTALADVDPVAVTMTMTRGEQVVSTGTGEDCLGDPMAAVAWLAATARDHGAPLRAGDIVLSGALGPMVPVCPGDTFTAHLSVLGAVQVSFTAVPEEAS